MMAPVAQTQNAQVVDDPFKRYGDAMKDFAQEAIFSVVDFSRQIQLLMALRNELMWRGKQYLKFSGSNDVGMSVVPVTTIPGGTTGPNEPQTLSYVMNVLRGDGQKFIAVVGGRVPHVTVTARDASDPESIKAARDQRAVAEYLDEIWDTDNAHKDLSRTIFRTGPQFGHVCMVNDPKYGMVTVDETELVDHQDPNILQCGDCGYTGPIEAANIAHRCPQCGSPHTSVQPGSVYQKLNVISSNQVPRGMPELHAYTIFEVTTPFNRKNLKECEYLDCCKLESVGKLRNLYGDLVANIRDDNPGGDVNASQETAGRAYDLIAAQGAAVTDRKDMWWWRRTWITPDMYPLCKNEDLKRAFYEHAPDGLQMVYCNSEYVTSVPEKLTDAWVACKTGTGELLLDDPLCNDLIPFQHITNDFFNLAVETMMRAIPKTVVDPRLLDRASLQDNPVNVAEILFGKVGLSGNIRDMVAQLPVASFSEQLIPLQQTLTSLRREIGGVQEAVYGGGEPAPTWRQDQQRKNQALAQFYIAWDEMRSYRENAITLALKLLEKFGMGSLEIPSSNPFRFKSHTVELEKINPALVKIETDESMPQNRQESFDEYKEQMALPPQVQAALGVFDSINVPRVVEMGGVEGITSTLSQFAEKVLRTIGILLQQQPMPGPDGQPGPSVQPDQFDFKNATFAVDIVRAYVNSPEAAEEETENPEGVQNVRLFGVALDKLATPPPPPPPPPNKSLSVSVTPAKDLPPNQAAALFADFGVQLPPPEGPSPAVAAELVKQAHAAPPPGGPPQQGPPPA